MADVRHSVKDLQTAVHGPLRVDFVEGVSPSMRSVEAVMREVAQSEVPVLLLGEGGAGKKATVRRIHDLSRHGRQAFRVIACAGWDEAKFSGSNGEAGLAGTGTVFLEEVAELGVEGQAWLLQALTRGTGNSNHPHPQNSGLGLARLICGS